jgi:16S rRNA G966 N2-methylase RsmD
MTDTSIKLELAFPTIDKKDINKLMIDEESLSYITIPSDANVIQTIITKYIDNKGKDMTIVDATGGAGGNTICFGSNFNRVISIELDPKRTLFLTNNVNVYNFKNIQILNGNCLDIIPRLYNFDIIFLDPPWGGKDYKIKKNLRIFLSDQELEQVIINFFDEMKMLCIPKLIAIKMPRNYDIKYFFDKVNGKNQFNIYLHRLKRMTIIIVIKK